MSDMLGTPSIYFIYYYIYKSLIWLMYHEQYIYNFLAGCPEATNILKVLLVKENGCFFKTKMFCGLLQVVCINNSYGSLFFNCLKESIYGMYL